MTAIANLQCSYVIQNKSSWIYMEIVSNINEVMLRHSEGEGNVKVQKE